MPLKYEYGEIVKVSNNDNLFIEFDWTTNWWHFSISEIVYQRVRGNVDGRRANLYTFIRRNNY